MSAVSFNDQETFAGHKIGISTAEAYTLMMVAFGLTLMNFYHMGNTLNAKLINEASPFIFEYGLYAIALCLAVLEFPVTKSMVTNYRLLDDGQRMTGAIFMQGLLLAVIIGAAGGGGVYSNMVDADEKDSRITSHKTQGSSFEDLKQVLISERNIKRSEARKLASANDISAGVSKANGEYFRALAALKMKQSGHQLTRPVSGATNGSIAHWVMTILISLLCSLGVVFISGYLAVYHKPLVGKPALSLRSKSQQDWILNKEDIISKKYEIDVLNNEGKSYVKMDRSTPLPASQNDSINTKSSETPKNHPPLDDSHLGAVLNTSESVSERSLNDDPERVPKMEYSADHYAAIKAGVIDGTIKPTLKPVKSALVALNIKFVDDAARQKKASSILAQLLEEGVLKANPEFGATGKVVAKYILNADYSNTASRDVSKESKSDIPYWIEEAEEMEHNQVPYFVFDDVEGGVYRLAILSPDRQETLCEFATLNAEEMANELREDESGNKPEKYTVFLSSLKQYRNLQKKESTK